jgi:hypothetical protein
VGVAADEMHQQTQDQRLLLLLLLPHSSLTCRATKSSSSGTSFLLRA